MIINFLFPGDIIEIDVNNEEIIKYVNKGKTKFMITSVTHFEVTDSMIAVLININDILPSLVKIRLIIDFKNNITKLSILTFLGNIPTILEQNLSSFSVLERSTAVKESRNYCKICFLKIREFCDGADKYCEYGKEEDTLSIGDSVKIKCNNKKGIIQSIYLDNNDRNVFIEYRLGVINSDVNFKLGIKIADGRHISQPLFLDPGELMLSEEDPEDVELIEKGGINIKSLDKICNPCILNNCSECNIKLIKNFIK